LRADREFAVVFPAAQLALDQDVTALLEVRCGERLGSTRRTRDLWCNSLWLFFQPAADGRRGADHGAI
jgi:hypothetical protein